MVRHQHENISSIPLISLEAMCKFASTPLLVLTTYGFVPNFASSLSHLSSLLPYIPPPPSPYPFLLLSPMVLSHPLPSTLFSILHLFPQQDPDHGHSWLRDLLPPVQALGSGGHQSRSLFGPGPAAGITHDPCVGRHTPTGIQVNELGVGNK